MQTRAETILRGHLSVAWGAGNALSPDSQPSEPERNRCVAWALVGRAFRHRGSEEAPPGLGELSAIQGALAHVEQLTGLAAVDVQTDLECFLGGRMRVSGATCDNVGGLLWSCRESQK